MTWNEERQAIQTAVDAFPATFGLRSFPGDTFRISLTSSYVNDSGVVMLYTEIQKDQQWLSFAKGTIEEVRVQVVHL